MSPGATLPASGKTSSLLLEAAPKRVAFISTRDANLEIYVMGADGSGPTRLTDHQARDLLPTWSPEGSMIAFLSDRDGTFKWWLMDTDGSNPRLMANVD